MDLLKALQVSSNPSNFYHVTTFTGNTMEIKRAIRVVVLSQNPTPLITKLAVNS